MRNRWRDYHFLPREAFADLQATGGLLEHTKCAGNGYGTLKAETEVILDAGIDIGFVLDASGCAALQQSLPGDVVSVYLETASPDVLRVRMLLRGDAPDAVEVRLKADRAHWAVSQHTCEHVVVNDDWMRPSRKSAGSWGGHGTPGWILQFGVVASMLWRP